MKESCLLDFTDWVESCVEAMEAAEAAGDSRKIFRLVNTLRNKPKSPPTNLSKDESGKLLTSPKEKAAVWFRFLKSKFEATPAEKARPPLEPLPTQRSHTDPLTREEFEAAVKKLKNGKATGPDGIPAEVYKRCKDIREELFKLLSFVWEHECLPGNLAVAKFVMLFKHKGSADDPTKYRCVGLLNHAYKVLSHILLTRLIKCTEQFLREWQAGFRQQLFCSAHVLSKNDGDRQKDRLDLHRLHGGI